MPDGVPFDSGVSEASMPRAAFKKSAEAQRLKKDRTFLIHVCVVLQFW